MTILPAPGGPYETGRDAYEDAVVLRAAIAAVDPGGTMTQAVVTARSKARTAYMLAVLAGAGVELGTHDRRIAEWVASWEIETIRAIAGWVERAFAERHGVMLAEIRRLQRRVAELEAADGGEC